MEFRIKREWLAELIEKSISAIESKDFEPGNVVIISMSDDDYREAKQMLEKKEEISPSLEKRVEDLELICEMLRHCNAETEDIYGELLERVRTLESVSEETKRTVNEIERTYATESYVEDAMEEGFDNFNIDNVVSEAVEEKFDEFDIADDIRDELRRIFHNI